MSLSEPDEIDKILKDTERMEQLFALEKERRGVRPNDLVFIGAANLANYWWCAMKAVLKSRANEMMFFASYLYDRLRYAKKLGLIDELPERDEELLEVGEGIGLAEVEKLLKQKEKDFTGRGLIILSQMWRTEDDEKVAVVNPYLVESERAREEAKLKAQGARVADIEEFPMLRGEFLQTAKAEQYPTIRWGFEWDKYVIWAVPDGITDEFVYEFKTTRSRWLLRYAKGPAMVQADIYGHLFKRPKKRVQFYIVEEDKLLTFEEEASEAEVLRVLRRFAAVDSGQPPRPPAKWKCKNCAYREICPIAA